MEGGENQTSSTTSPCTSSRTSSSVPSQCSDQAERSSGNYGYFGNTSQDGNIRTASEQSRCSPIHSGHGSSSTSTVSCTPSSEQLLSAVRTGILHGSSHASFTQGTLGAMERMTKTACDRDLANTLDVSGSHDVLCTPRRRVQTPSRTPLTKAQVMLQHVPPANFGSAECRPDLPVRQGDSQPPETDRVVLNISDELKMHAEHAGGWGEHIHLLKPGDVGDVKAGVVGELTSNVLAYPMLETGGHLLYGELGYDNSTGKVREMLKNVDRSVSMSTSEGGYEDKIDLRHERPKRRSRARRRDYGESKQKYRDTTSPFVASIVNEAVDDLMDEFQTPEVMGAESDSHFLGYRLSRSLTTVCPSLQELEKVRTVCNMLESITGDMRNEVQSRKIESVGLDENKRSSMRKKSGRKAKKVPMKQRDAIGHKSAATMEGNVAVRGNDESENDDCDENKSKRVRFFTNLVFRNDAPSALDISSSHDGAVLTVKRSGSLSAFCDAEDGYEQNSPLVWSSSTPVNDETVNMYSSLESICCFGDPEESDIEDDTVKKKAEKRKKKGGKRGDDGGKNEAVSEEGRDTPTKESRFKAKKRSFRKEREKSPKGKQNGDDDNERRGPGKGDGGVSVVVSTKTAVNNDEYGRRKPREENEKKGADMKTRKRRPRDDRRDVESDRWQKDRPEEESPVEDSGRKRDHRESDHRSRDQKKGSDSDMRDRAPADDYRTEVESDIGDRKPQRHGYRTNQDDFRGRQRSSGYRRDTEVDFLDRDPKTEHRRDTERGFRDKDPKPEHRRDTEADFWDKGPEPKYRREAESGFRKREQPRDYRRTGEDDFRKKPPREHGRGFQSEFEDRPHGRWKDEAGTHEQRRNEGNDLNERRASREEWADAGPYSSQTSRERWADTADPYRQHPRDEWTDARAERRRSEREPVAEGHSDERREPLRKERQERGGNRGKGAARSHRRDEDEGYGARRLSQEWAEGGGGKRLRSDLGSPPPSPPTVVRSPTGSVSDTGYLRKVSESDSPCEIYGRVASGDDLGQPQIVRQVSSEGYVGRRDMHRRTGFEQDIDNRTGKATDSEVPLGRRMPCRTSTADDMGPEMAVRMKIGRRLRHRVKDTSEQADHALPGQEDHVGSSLGQENTFMASPKPAAEQLRPNAVERVMVRRGSQLAVRNVEPYEKGSRTEVRWKDKSRSPKKKREAEKGSAPTLPSIYEDCRSKFEDETGTRHRINVWHIPPEDLERHLTNIASKRSASKRSKRSKSKRSGSRRGGGREIKDAIGGEMSRYCYGEETASNPGVVEGAISQNEGTALEVELCSTKQMQQREPGMSLSLEMINQPEVSVQRSEQDGEAPYFTTRVRRSLRIPPSSVPFPSMLGTVITTPDMQRTSGMNGVQGGMPAQQAAIVPGFGGRTALTQASAQIQSPLQQSTVRVIRPTAQTFVLPAKGGQTILTQLTGQPATMSHETGSKQASPAERARQPITEQFRLQATPVSQPYTAQQTGPAPGDRAPGPVQQVLVFQSSPPCEPPEQKQGMSQQEPYQEHWMTPVKRDIRHIIAPGPVPMAPMTSTFIARTPMFPNSPQMQQQHNVLYPRSPWQRQRYSSRRPLGPKTGFISPQRTRRAPHSAVSQPALVPGDGTMPHASHSFVTAFETAEAPATVRIPKSIQTLASTSAPALDRVSLSATASVSYSNSSVSGEDEVHTTTDSPWQTEPPDEWDRGKPGSTDMILPKETRHTGSAPKGLRGATNKGRYVLYFAFLVVSLAGLVGALSLYSKRRWTNNDEEEGPEGAEGAKMFGPMQRVDNARNVSSNSTRSCTNLQCSLEAQSLTRALDRSVNPCDDFYGYACSSQWKSGGAYASVDAAVQADIERAVVTFFKDGTPRSPDVAASTQFWRDCINVEAIAELGKGPFDGILNVTGLGDWPYATYNHQSDVFDAWKVAGKVMRHIGLSPLLKVMTVSSVGHQNKEVNLARGEDIPLARKDVHKAVARDALAADVVKAIQVIHDTGFKHNEIATEVVDFVCKLSLLDDGDAKRQEELSSTLRPFVTSALGEQSFLPGNSTAFTMRTSKFVDAVISLVGSTSSRVTLNYLGFCVVQHTTLFTPASARKVISFDRRGHVAATREAQCVRALLNSALPRHVAEHVSYVALNNNIDLPALRVLSADIRKSLVSRISRLHWMDTTTRSHAVRHLREVEIRFFFEDSPVSNSSSQRSPVDSLPDIIPSQALLSYQRLRAYRFRSSLDDSLESVSNWSGSFSHPDCTYYAGRRVLLLPLVTLNIKDALSPFWQLFQVPRFGVKVLRCLLRVLLGGNIDSQGRTPSLIKGWWTLPARRHYESIRACLDKQYLMIRDPIGNKMAHRQDLLAALNVIDNAVIGPDKDVYEVYAYPLGRTGTVQENEALDNVSWEQLFYASYARSMCEVLDHDLNFRRATTLHESPNWERVNIPLGNDDQFMRAFKCGGSSAMNREPRCRIWG